MATLTDVYSSEEEQALLARIIFPRYERMLTAVHQMVASNFPELSPDEFRLDDAATRKLLALAGQHVVMIDEHTRTRLQRVLQQGQLKGYSDVQIANGVPEEGYLGVTGLYLNTWKSRAETIARTEVSTAQVAASLDRYQATGLVSEVELVEHTDTDDACARRNGKVVPISSRPQLNHPNCLPGDQLVWAPDVVGATVRQFEGEVFTLRTAADDLLTCTPNHPVLTLRGWVPANALREGEYVLRSRSGQGVTVGGALHDDHVPARIEDVARALLVAGGGPSATVPGAAPQFHGDGVEGDVHVVWADGLRQAGHDQAALPHPAIPKPLGHLGVEWADAESPLHAGIRPSLKVGAGAGHPAHGVVGGAGIGAALLGRHAPHPQAVAFADAPHLPPSALEGPAEVGGVGAEAAGDILQRYAGLVEPVRLVSVGKRQFRGHVYNLQTERGWYVAQGIITHNCRLALIPVVKEPVFAPTPSPEAEAPAVDPNWGKFKIPQQAEAAAKQRYPHIDFDFKGMHPDAINPTLVQFAKLAEDYPQVVDRLEYIGGYQRVAAPSSSQGFSGDASNVYAHASRDGKRIGLNPRHYRDAKKLTASLENDLASGFHVKGGASIEAVLTHEFGHQVQNWLQSVPSNIAAFPTVSVDGSGIVATTASRWGRTHKATKALSGYATHNKEEGWAEAFTAQYHAPASVKRMAYVKKQAALLKALHPDNWLGPGEWRWSRDLPPDERPGAFERNARWREQFE